MIFGESVCDAYCGMLKSTLEGSLFLQVTMVQPVVEGPQCIRAAFESYEFPDGRTGKWWIEDRIKALFDEKGEYWRSMHREGQFDYVISALNGMTNGTMPRWNANRLIISLFDPKMDLHKSRAPTPPCLINLSFYPVKKTLSLIATFRAQYTDAKGLGNLLSLAMLLKDVSEKTGFHPSKLYSIAQKVTLKYPTSTAKNLHHQLIVSINRS